MCTSFGEESSRTQCCIEHQGRVQGAIYPVPSPTVHRTFARQISKHREVCYNLNCSNTPEGNGNRTQSVNGITGRHLFRT